MQGEIQEVEVPPQPRSIINLVSIKKKVSEKISVSDLSTVIIFYHETVDEDREGVVPQEVQVQVLIRIPILAPPIQINLMVVGFREIGIANWPRILAVKKIFVQDFLIVVVFPTLGIFRTDLVWILINKKVIKLHNINVVKPIDSSNYFMMISKTIEEKREEET